MEEALFQAEMAQSEQEWLRYQIRSLQQALQDQTQELQKADRQLELMNCELQEMLQVLPPSLIQARKFAETLLAEKRSAIEVAEHLLSFIYGETVEPGTPAQFESTNSGQLFVALPPLSERGSAAEEAAALRYQLRRQRAIMRSQFAQLKSQVNALSTQIKISQRFSARSIENSRENP